MRAGTCGRREPRRAGLAAVLLFLATLHAVDSRGGSGGDGAGGLAGEEECTGAVCGAWTFNGNRSEYWVVKASVLDYGGAVGLLGPCRLAHQPSEWSHVLNTTPTCLFRSLDMYVLEPLLI
jgi:hypothetical protein